MNSEKVKEIKESLQQEIHLAEYVDSSYSENVSLDLLKDVLTLINELESENERLMKLQTRGGYRVAELVIENQQLKDKVTELESENKELKVLVDISNEREYRKKFIEEWRKEYQKELDKEGEGHIAGFPDFDLVYKLYFEQKDRIAELENTDYYKEITCKYLKEFAERLKECAQTNLDHCTGFQKVILTEQIDELLKECEKWTEVKAAYQIGQLNESKKV